MKSTVYFSREISQQSLLKLFDAMGVELKGNVCVKLSSGEQGGSYFLNAQMIKPLVEKVNGTIVECCTAYHGQRDFPQGQWDALKRHGFCDIAPCDVMDEHGEVKLPVEGGKNLNGFNLVGKNLLNYDSMLVLSHFKGHVAGGFGGALKNISIGIASRNGKARLHSAGISDNPDECWNHTQNQDGFLESMAEASWSVINYFKKENVVYINVANNLSVDCDCNPNPAKPEMADIGIFASIDPVALDQCCYDSVKHSHDCGKHALIERMDSRHGIHTVEFAHELGLGNREYEIVEL